MLAVPYSGDSQQLCDAHNIVLQLLAASRSTGALTDKLHAPSRFLSPYSQDSNLYLWMMFTGPGLPLCLQRSLLHRLSGIHTLGSIQDVGRSQRRVHLQQVETKSETYTRLSLVAVLAR